MSLIATFLACLASAWLASVITLLDYRRQHATTKRRTNAPDHEGGNCVRRYLDVADDERTLHVVLPEGWSVSIMTADSGLTLVESRRAFGTEGQREACLIGLVEVEAQRRLAAPTLMNMPHRNVHSSETRVNPNGPKFLLPEEDTEWTDMSHRDLLKHMDEEEQ